MGKKACLRKNLGKTKVSGTAQKLNDLKMKKKLIERREEVI